MMKRRFRISLAMVGLIALHCFASSYARDGMSFLEPEDLPSFKGWSRDSVIHYVDTLLMDVWTPDTLDPMADLDTLDETAILLDTPDSVQNRVDSLFRIVYVRDSIERAKIAFQHWFDSLPKKEQKKWIIENVTIPAKIARADSILAVKDSIKAIKDSITENTPRILESPFIPDSLRYKRLLYMTQDKKFGDLRYEKFDTSYNAHFYDYPFFQKDVNATWVGVAGSPTQLQNVYKRQDEEDAIFYTTSQNWSHTPDNLPIYNTKTPYTELAYYGTLLSGKLKEEINCRLLTTQNITPGLNLTFELNKYSGQGHLQKGDTDAYDLAISTSYFGKRYSAHAGWIHSKISRTENGGIVDPFWIRDTTVSSREIDVNLKEASSKVEKNTLFINHRFRIPFGSDSLTTTFIGHNLNWTMYRRLYGDNISDATGKAFYNNAFYINPTKSSDTLKVMNLDNSLFLRLQPWKADAILSRIDAGIGDKLLTYYDFYKEEKEGGTVFYNGQTVQNNIYAYAGLGGMFKKYFSWDATGKLYFAGPKAGDFDVDAAMNINFYPFRKSRKSPLTVGADFHMDLSIPDHYEQRLLLNHFYWENDFKRKSTMKIGGYVDIPYWRLNAEVGYTLLGNPIYYDETAVIRQGDKPVSIITASIYKTFKLWKFYFDNKILLQFSSNNDVVPVPLLSLNLRYYIEFDVVKNAMKMQIGANALYTTTWKLPAYNPNLGVFYNQTTENYGNCPYIDIFLNIQWKRACIFIKGENINQGWPRKKGMDYFTAANYIHAQRTVKFGITWPFYIQPGHSHSSHEHGRDASDIKKVNK